MAREEMAGLIARVRQRDEPAARALVERLGPDIARIVNSYPTLREDSEDLMQDIFLKIFNKLPTFRGDAPLEHWASRLARFACIDRLRKKKARPEHRISDLTVEQAALLDNLAAEDAQASTRADAAGGLLDQLLSTLRPLDAWLLREVELAQRSLADVAAEAGWNAGLASVRLFRARRRLRRAFEKLEPPKS